VRFVFSGLKESPLPWTWDEVVHYWQTAFPAGPAGFPVTRLPFPGHNADRVVCAMPCNVWEFCISGRMDVRMSPNCTAWNLVFPAAIIRRNLTLQFEFHFGLDFLYSFTL
jgi:hypothetical protein